MLQRRNVMGVIHLKPLPGTPNGSCSLQEVLDAALSDAMALREGGVVTTIIENFGDAPFVRGSVDPHIVAMMTRIAERVKEHTGLELGINVLRNDALAALAIAATVGAKFVRVNVHTGAAWTDQGLIQGEAYQTLQYRKQLGVDVQIAADVMVKHATPAGNRTLLDAAKDTVFRGQANALILTGTATGSTVDFNELKQLREDLPQVPLWIGSGIDISNIQQAIPLADAVIVGTYFHEDGQLTKSLDPKRIKQLLQMVP